MLGSFYVQLFSSFGFGSLACSLKQIRVSLISVVETESTRHMYIARTHSLQQYIIHVSSKLGTVVDI